MQSSVELPTFVIAITSALKNVYWIFLDILLWKTLRVRREIVAPELLPVEALTCNFSDINHPSEELIALIMSCRLTNWPSSVKRPRKGCEIKNNFMQLAVICILKRNSGHVRRLWKKSCEVTHPINFIFLIKTFSSLQKYLKYEKRQRERLIEVHLQQIRITS